MKMRVCCSPLLFLRKRVCGFSVVSFCTTNFRLPCQGPLPGPRAHAISPQHRTDALGLLNMDTQVAIDALGVSGTLLSNGLAFANLPAMMEARAQGDLGDINPVVFPILFGNGAAWCLYSVVKKVDGVSCGSCRRSCVSAVRDARGVRRAGDGCPALCRLRYGPRPDSVRHDGGCWQDIYMFGGNILGAVLGLLYVMIAIRVVRCPAVCSNLAMRLLAQPAASLAVCQDRHIPLLSAILGGRNGCDLKCCSSASSCSCRSGDLSLECSTPRPCSDS